LQLQVPSPFRGLSVKTNGAIILIPIPIPPEGNPSAKPQKRQRAGWRAKTASLDSRKVSETDAKRGAPIINSTASWPKSLGSRLHQSGQNGVATKGDGDREKRRKF